MSVIYMMLMLMMSSFSYAVVGTDFTFQRFSRDVSPLNRFNEPSYIGEATTITQAGIYGLNANIEFDPANPNESCIVIDADDVVIDLNLRSIVQVSTNMQTGINAIEIMPGHRNIVIRNGAIRGFSGSGILVHEGALVIDFANLTVLNCGTGINLDASGGAPIEDSIFLNIIISNLQDSTDIRGLSAQNCRTMIMENILISNSAELTGNFQGMYFDNCQSGLLRACIVSQNQTSGAQMSAYYIENGDNMAFADCNAAHNVTTSVNPLSFATGFWAGSSQEVLLRDCTIANNNAVMTSQGVEFDTCVNSFIVDSQVTGHQSNAVATKAVYVHDGTDNLVRRTRILGNKSATGDSYGVHLENEQLSVVNECEIKGNNSGGVAYGISLNGCMGCAVQKNGVAAHRGLGGGYGIFDDGGLLSLADSILANTASGNTINYDPGAPAVLIFPGPLTDTPSPFENISL